MTAYESACKLVKAQIDSLSACRAMHHPDIDIDSAESAAVIHDTLLKDALSMAIAVMVRLDVINDNRNDQCQASARELAKLLAARLDINLSDKLGIEL